MTLSKLEIQQMLREMNVKFDADETYDELKQRLQKENHSLWLKSVSGDRGATRPESKVRYASVKRPMFHPYQRIARAYPLEKPRRLKNTNPYMPMPGKSDPFSARR
ncbi:hypothetical protein [Desulfosarcina cetonica]|uniref:hypothetical protein n=1 Tax=Desulfosarcina cetonica TaxID=90730 RepID=UPI0006CFAA65|nr:hypothetical protein [Desulfosarcina cetonica]